jgi:hypothetical protein
MNMIVIAQMLSFIANLVPDWWDRQEKNHNKPVEYQTNITFSF